VAADGGSLLNNIWIGPTYIEYRALGQRQRGGKGSVYSQLNHIITWLVRPKADFKIDQSTRTPRQKAD
jgi:hypothetical protein